MEVKKTYLKAEAYLAVVRACSVKDGRGAGGGRGGGGAGGGGGATVVGRVVEVRRGVVSKEKVSVGSKEEGGGGV